MKRSEAIPRLRALEVFFYNHNEGGFNCILGALINEQGEVNKKESKLTNYSQSTIELRIKILNQQQLFKHPSSS